MEVEVGPLVLTYCTNFGAMGCQKLGQNALVNGLEGVFQPCLPLFAPAGDMGF